MSTPSIDPVYIEIGNSQYALEDLLSWFSAGETTLVQNLESEYLNLSEEDRATFSDDVKKALDEAIQACKDLRDLYDGYGDEARSLDDTSDEEYWEEAEDMVRELLDQISDYDFSKGFDEALESIQSRYHITNEDVFVGTLEYEDGDTVYIQSTAEVYDYFEEDEELTDIDGDGFITANDYDAEYIANAETLYENSQNLFLSIEEGFELSLVSFSSDSGVGTAEFEATNPETGKTVSYVLSGLSEGAQNILIDSIHEAVTEAEYSSWPEELQKLVHLNDDIYTVYERVHQSDDISKLSMIENYDNIASEENFANTQAYWDAGGTLSSEAAYEIYTESLELIFDVYNKTPTGEVDALTGMDEAWNTVFQNLSTLSAVDQANILKSLTVGIAYQGQEQDFIRIFGTTTETGSAVIQNIEDRLFVNGSLSTNSAAVITLLEMHGASVGKYGGLEFLNNVMTIHYEAASTEQFLEGSFPAEFTDPEFLSQMLAVYEELAGSQIPWILTDGTTASLIEDLEDKIEASETGFYDTVDADWAFEAVEWAAAANALVVLSEDANDTLGTDGITQGTYETLVKDNINNFAAVVAASAGADITTLGQALLDYLNEQIALGLMNQAQDGDVLAGVLFYLNEVCPDIVKSICADPNFVSQAIDIIGSENNPTAKCLPALSLLHTYQLEAATAPSFEEEDPNVRYRPA